MKRLMLLLVLMSLGGCSEPEPDVREGAESEPMPHDPPAMPPTGHRIEWGAAGVPCEMKPGAKVPVSVFVKNAGDQLWPAASTTATGFGAVRLGSRWWSPKDPTKPLVDYTYRGDLGMSVPPGQTATMTVEVTAPTTPGSYLLQFDLVEELVVWFENKGAAKLMVPVTVK